MVRYFLFIFSFFIVSVVFAEGKIVISNSQENAEYELKGNLFYLIDEYSEFEFDQVLSKEFENKFTQAVKSEFYFSRNSKTQWYKLEIVNRTDDIQELILGINNPLVQKITLFSSVDSVFYTTGALFPYHQRQIESNKFLYKVNLKPGNTGVYCVRIEGQAEALFVPFSLTNREESDNGIKKNQFFNGLFYTIVLIMLFLLFLLWNTEKEKVYVYFLLLIIVIVAYELWRSNILFYVLWPNYPWFNWIIGRSVISILLLSILLFGNQLLNLIRINNVLKKSVLTIVYLTIAFIFGQYFIVSVNVFSIIFKLISILIIGTLSIGILVSIRQQMQYYKRFAFIITLLIIYIFAISFMGYDIKAIGNSDFHISRLILTLFFIIIGSLFVDKFKSSRVEVIDLSKNLEHLVDKRTVQLNSQKEELKSQHEELLLQKETLQMQREELRAQKELLEIKNQELEKLSLVASKTDNLIYIFKPNGELDWFNSSFSLIFGMSYEEYKLNEPKSMVDLSLNKNIRHVFNTCLREKTVVSYENKLNGENDETLWYHTTLTPILDKNEDVRLLIAIDTNITKLKQYEIEINRQRNDAEEQKNLAVQRKEELEERQIEITDSIRYAKRIQTAIMPKIKQIQRDFPASFVLFLPKDIVSGDFYWYHRIGDKYFIAAVDCTGHGVPGAFMSIIGNYLLNSIIIHNGIIDPAEILKQLNRKIKIAMKTDGRAQTTDGMDISVAVIDKNEQMIEYAGALRPMYLFNQGDFIEIKGDKIPITSSIAGITISTFKTKTFEFKEGDIFYLFSDGIIDQFGGTKGKKFLTKRFKQLLFEINELPLPEQKELIKKAFDDWKGTNEQVDDILVMGVKC